VGDHRSPISREARSVLAGLIRVGSPSTADPDALADRLLGEFRSFGDVVAGSPARLRRSGADAGVMTALTSCRAAISVALREAAFEGAVISSWSALLRYLQFDLASDTTERFKALFLNARNELLADETISTGTVDGAPFYPREIIGRALEIGATSLVIAHNHPSGDPVPSREDLDCTRALDALCKGLGITLIDHVIVGRLGTVSLNDSTRLPR
jgi:DNA repair protein RadC